MTFDDLKKYKKAKSIASESLRIRVHRAISWGAAAKKEKSLDSRFIFYWISFNALYSNDTEDQPPDKDQRYSFFEKILGFDKNSSLAYAIMRTLNSIKILLENKFVYSEFWKKYQDEGEPGFELVQERHKKQVYERIINNDQVLNALDSVFSKIYLLRNQVFHGLATYGGKLNREQLTAATNILEALVPIMIEIVIDNDNEDWGELSFPPLNN